MKRSAVYSLSFAAALLLVSALPCQAQAPIIALTVDATGAPQKLLRTHMEMSAASGPLTFYFPKWIPGLHEPAGPIGNVTGLQFTADGKAIPWRRDLLDVFTFHIDMPAGASRLGISFDYVEPAGPGGPAAGMATDKLLVLNWNQVLLYPAGVPASKETFEPKLRLPPGWNFGSALPVANRSGSEIEFRNVSLERLVDSPLIAGQYYRDIDLTPPGEPIHHEIDIVADSEAALAMPPDVQKGMTNLVAETGKMFASRHYREYHFLLTLSDHTGHFGVEHHESNDSRLPERVFLSPGAGREMGSLLAHEFAHSWSGKFRRPLDEATPDYQTPMKTDLLWVYEGNTSYLGDVLATRSGLWTAEEYRQAMADNAANLSAGRPGRTWRPLLDTAVAVPGRFGGGGWGNWRRGADYYEEGELIWLEAATIIHDQSHGQKSIDDFFRAFYGGPNHGPEVKPYTFEQLVQTLNDVVPYDWADFFNARLTSTSAQAPLGGIESGGWKLDFTSEPPQGERTTHRISDTAFSLGLNLNRDGAVLDSTFGGPAFKAGIAPGMKIAGVNGRVFTPQILNDAIQDSQKNSRPIQLLVINDDYFKTCSVDAHGPRYPHLVRDASTPDYLDQLLKP